MRPNTLLCFLFLAIGVSGAQDTNFPVGPQYLLSGSPLFAQPIATPSLSLEAPLPGIPSLPAVGPAVSNEPYVSNPEIAHQADLFPVYYGYPRISPVALIPTDVPRALLGNFVDVGVIGIADSQSLRERGFGVSVGEAASYWKAHKRNTTRVITNRDVELAWMAPPRELHLSVNAGVNAGVTGIIDVQAARERGSDISLGEAASIWKNHKPHASRIITNRDIERLGGIRQ